MALNFRALEGTGAGSSAQDSIELEISLPEQDLRPDTFDQVAIGRKEKIWGARQIGRFLGVSEDTVRAWAKDPDVPIYVPRRGTYFALRSELEKFLRRKPAA